LLRCRIMLLLLPLLFLLGAGAELDLFLQLWNEH
jgi:hypothetical protein